MIALDLALPSWRGIEIVHIRPIAGTAEFEVTGRLEAPAENPGGKPRAASRALAFVAPLRDFLIEVGLRDVDKDGGIVLMRFRSPAGSRRPTMTLSADVADALGGITAHRAIALGQHPTVRLICFE